jgi:metallo-beta-lactamase family protein
MSAEAYLQQVKALVARIESTQQSAIRQAALHMAGSIAAGRADVRPDLAAEDPFDVGDLRETRTPQQSKAINAERGPAVIISASGMATGGRVLHHLKYRLRDPRNTVLFVGFQANGTRGQLLKDGAREIKIHGEQVPVRAQIRSMESFSRHADSEEILNWLSRVRVPPKRTWVVHGEPEASAALADGIRKTLGWKVEVPDYLDVIELK